MFFYQYILIPCLCALTTATAAAPIGALIGWRRLVYFGEALSHASLLGIALALWLGLPPAIGIWSITLLLVLLLYLIERSGRENPSNILGSLSHIALALGYLVMSQMENVRTDLLAYLFGDILATEAHDLVAIVIAAAVSLLTLRVLWQPLILMTVSPAIAKTEYPASRRYDLAVLRPAAGHRAAHHPGEHRQPPRQNAGTKRRHRRAARRDGNHPRLHPRL